MAAIESQLKFLQRYSYVSLLTISSFRVLELLPGEPDDDILIRLHQADWVNPPSYEAISYAWGDPNIKVQIVCDNLALAITPNLLDGLRQMRLKGSPRYLWADAICINQEDIQERGHQVSNMLKIYQNATLVLVWLGVDEDGQTEEASTIIKDIAGAACKRLGISLSDLRNVDDLWSLFAAEMEDLASEKELLSSSLSWFYSRPWFSRLWVYQEVNAGTEGLVMCGSTCLSWETVALTATLAFNLLIRPHFLIPKVSVRKLGELDVVFKFPSIMRFRQSPGSKQARMIDLLHICRRFSCSDPRDRVFALLGMPAFIECSSVIEADYTKSKIDLYQQVFCFSLVQNSKLEILSVVQHKELIDSSVPSWIPFWDQPIRATRIFNGTLEENYTAALDTIPSTTIDFVAHVLKVRGICLDVVMESKATYLQWLYGSEGVPDAQKDDLLRYCIAARKRDSQYITGENTMEVISMVLRAGLDNEGFQQGPNESQIQADFASLIKMQLKNAGLDTNLFPELIAYAGRGDPSKFEYGASKMGYRRTIFRTSKGHVGLGPDILLPGDIAVVFFGGGVPYILRPQNGHYLFVGEAYIHGIMHGEVIHQWRDGTLRDEVFEIH